MGRRPNQLVLEFFHRGPKLNDNSNRYEQKCKACGELFRKGRVEILTKHIERCSAVYNQDDGDIDVPSAYALSKKYLSLSTRSGNHLSGLEALAEASSRRDRDHLIDPNLQEEEQDARNTSVARKGFNVTNTAYAIPGVAQSNIASSLIKYISHDTLGDHLTTESITTCPPIPVSMIAASATNLEATTLQSRGDSQQIFAKPSVQTALAMNSPSLGPKSTSVQPRPEDDFLGIEKPQQMTSNTGLQATSQTSTSLAIDTSGHRRPNGRAQKVRDCVRTNIYKELEIYSSNLFTSIASNCIKSATSSLVMNPQRRILKISLQGQSSSDIKLQMLLVGGRVSESNEELSKKLLQFLRASATILYSVEGSSIIRKSVFLAYELANKNEVR
ncbi:MAG: hypothetical protein Q9214_003561 [Letrouitia sp. 1 TL-2023]